MTERARKRSKFSQPQIAFVLKKAEDGTKVGEVCLEVRISDVTFFAWCKRYAGIPVAPQNRPMAFAVDYPLPVGRHRRVDPVCGRRTNSKTRQSRATY